MRTLSGTLIHHSLSHALIRLYILCISLPSQTRYLSKLTTMDDVFLKKNKKQKNKSFSPIWTAMKKSLRQDAEHKNPIVDLDWSLFSSGVCWHLPVPSVIIKKTSVFPPDSWLSVSGVFYYRSWESMTSSPHLLSLLGVAVSFHAFLRWQAQLLAFQHWGI